MRFRCTQVRSSSRLEKKDLFTIEYVPFPRHALVFLLIALLGFIPTVASATLTNGANAIDMVGQTDDNLLVPAPLYSKGVANNGPNALGFDTPSGVAIDEVGHRLFVSDTNNNRVLVYALNADDTFADRLPDNVLGQGSFSTNASATTQNTLSNPYGLAYDPTNSRLFVADYTNVRVLVFSVPSITNGQNALNVLGQSVFTLKNASNTQNALYYPYGLSYDATNSRLFVSEPSANAVVVHNVASITNGQNALNVLGQPNYASIASGITQNGMSGPRGLAYDPVSSRLFIAESGNNRVIVQSTVSITNGQNAANVLGQPNFSRSASATTQNGLSGPYGVAYDATHSSLFIEDATNKRVLIQNVTSITDGQNAMNVLGQSTFTANAAGSSQSTLNLPYGLAYDTTRSRLFIADTNNHRLLMHDVSAMTNGQNATDALGQYDDNFSTPAPVYTKNAVNNISKIGLNAPYGVALDTTGHRLFVSDFNNHRVLVYGLTANNAFVDAVPDNILGQDVFYSPVAATTQNGMNNPYGLAYDAANSRLFVSEFSNNRVTIFSVASIANGQNAANVLGQPNFTRSTAGTSQAVMTMPYGLAYDAAGSRLFVAEITNNRITIFSVASIANGQNATGVLGRPDFGSSTAATTQNGVSAPRGISYDPTNSRLFITESSNHRVTVHNVASIINGQNAANVLGQPNFTRAVNATTQNGLDTPHGVVYDATNSRLFVAESVNNRIVVYDVASITNGQNAANVLGQPNFTRATAGTTQNGLSSPRGLAYDSQQGRLFVGEIGNFRVTEFDASVPDSTPPTVLSANSVKANGSYNAGAIIDIIITFSEVVTSTGDVTVTLDTGGTCTFQITGATSASCNYTVGAGQTSADLTVSSVAGTVKDASLNVMVSPATPTTNLATNKDMVIDTTPPATPSASPSGGTFTSAQSVTLSSAGSSAIYYTTNGDIPTTASTLYTGAISIASTTTLKALAVDAATNQSGVMTESYTIDSTSPSGGSITYTDGYFTSASVPITYTIGTDSGSGLLNSSGRIQRASATLANGSCGTFGVFADLVSEYDGAYTDSTVASGNCYKYQYLIADNVGNTATYTSANSAKIDTAIPTTTDDFEHDNVWQKTNQTITLTPSDTGGSGIAWTKYCTDTNNTCTPSSGTAYSAPVTIAAEGTTYFRYASQDNATNVQTTVSRTVKIDKTNPTVSAGSDQLKNSPFTQTATASDGGSGINASSYQWSSISGPGTITFGSATALSTTISASLDGTYVLQFSASDNVTNAASSSFTLTWDTTPPVITITNPPTSPALSKTVSASTSDGTLTMSTTTGVICDGTLTFIAYVSQTFSSESDNGTRVCYRASDTVGNTSYSMANAIAGIDRTPPATPSASPSGGTFTSAQSVTLSAAGSSAIYYTTNGDIPTTASTLYTGAISIASTTTLKALAVDAATNQSGVMTESYTLQNETSTSVTSLPVLRDTTPTGGVRRKTLEQKILQVQSAIPLLAETSSSLHAAATGSLLPTSDDSPAVRMLFNARDRLLQRLVASIQKTTSPAAIRLLQNTQMRLTQRIMAQIQALRGRGKG